MTVDDHFQTRQADAGIRQHGKIECPFRIGNVHHDFHRSRWHLCQVGGNAFKCQSFVVNKTGVALRARNRNDLSVLNTIQCIRCADYCRYAEFTRNDCRMTSSATAIGNNCRGTLHDGLPIGIGHVGHQNIARLHAIHIGERSNYAGNAGSNLVADGATFANHFAAFV